MTTHPTIGPIDPIDLDAPWPNGEIRLWDSQWVNIVNGDCANPALAREEAINLAIKFTERAMRKNYEAELTTRRARDAEVGALVAEADELRMMFTTVMMRLCSDEEEMEQMVSGIKAALLPFQRSDDKGDAT